MPTTVSEVLKYRIQALFKSGEINESSLEAAVGKNFITPGEKSELMAEKEEEQT
jgi:hypothetical protein